MFYSFMIYIGILASIGLYFYKRTSSASDYMIGNRSLNYWVTAVATQASDMGSWLFLGFPAAVCVHGLFEYWTAIGLIVFMFLNWHYIAPALRKQTEYYNALTLSTYFAHRLSDHSGILRIISACITIFFFTYYIAAGLMGLGRLFEAAFALDYQTGLFLGLICGISYTLVGGFLAIAWCDFFQGLFLLAVIVLVPIVAWYHVGGYQTIVAAALHKGISLSLLNPERSLLSALLLAAGWGLGYFGQPHILTNFMAIDSPKDIAKAKWVGISWQTIVLTASALIGIIGIAYAPQIQNPERLFIVITQQLFTPFFAGFILCAIAAATLSTLDSHILISGSTYAEDIYQQLFEKHASSKKLMWISRGASFVISCLGLAIAIWSSYSVYDLVNYAWSGIGSAFGPLVLTTLFSKHTTTRGAISGILVGAVVSAIWPYFGIAILPLVPGFGLGLVANIIVSKK